MKFCIECGIILKENNIILHERYISLFEYCIRLHERQIIYKQSIQTVVWYKNIKSWRL